MSDLPNYQMPLPIVSEEDVEEILKARTLYNAVKQTVRGLEYLHRPVENDPGTCIECWQQMPCATRRALVELKLAAGIEGDIQGAEEDNFDPEFDYLVSREDYTGEDPIPGLEPPPDQAKWADRGTWDGIDWREYEDYEKGTD